MAAPLIGDAHKSQSRAFTLNKGVPRFGAIGLVSIKVSCGGSGILRMVILVENHPHAPSHAETDV